ncbi:hypothetical protein ACFXPP_00595, partial [Streptomyces sp. NPDC059134]
GAGPPAAGVGGVPTQLAGSGAGPAVGGGPPPPPWTAGVAAGHNNFFVDSGGDLWGTFFRNPNFGYWSHPSRIADAAVPGVVRLEWTGPKGNRLYVRRADGGRGSGA